MFFCRFADLVFRIENRFPHLEKQCREFMLSSEEAQPFLSGARSPDLTVAVTDAELEAERTPDGYGTNGYLESLAVYRKICHRMPAFDGFLFHCAVISFDGAAVAFTAPSGTGKTTHIRLWQQVFGDRVEVINGDKPLLRFMDEGLPYACGTPWRGKEGLGGKKMLPLQAVCVITRGKENKLTPLGQDEIVPLLFSQILIPPSPEGLLRQMELLDRFVSAVPFYRMTCNMEPEAALVACRGIFGEKN